MRCITIQSNEISPTYVEVVCEARVNATEKNETIEELLRLFIEGDVMIDKRFDGTFLVIRNSNEDALQIFGELVRQNRLLDTIRKRLIKSITGNVTALYFNRQAAAMGRLSLIDINDNPPLGPIALQIVSDGLQSIINQVAPSTYEGSEISTAEWEKIRKAQEKNVGKKKKSYKSSKSD
ncbi:MAG: hypothetical protein ACXAB7_06915 [Candidatus Kariarchaeaceae archaeon]